MPNPSEETEAQKDRNAPPNHAEPGCARPRRPVPHGLGPGTRGAVRAPCLAEVEGRTPGLTGQHQDVGLGAATCQLTTPARTGLLELRIPHAGRRWRAVGETQERLARGARSACLGLLKPALVQSVGWGHGALDWERWQLTDSSFKVSPRYRHQWSCQVRKLRHREDTCQRSRRPSVGTQDSHLRGRLPPLTVTCNR